MSWRWQPPAAEGGLRPVAPTPGPGWATARGLTKPEEEMGKGSDLLARLCPHQQAVTTADAPRSWQVCRYSPEPVAPGALALWRWSSTWGVEAVPIAPEAKSSGSDPLSPVPSVQFQNLPHIIVPILPMTSYEPNFWNTIATFCRELAPVSGALLDSISQTAAAINRAGDESLMHGSKLQKACQPTLFPENEGFKLRIDENRNACSESRSSN